VLSGCKVYQKAKQAVDAVDAAMLTTMMEGVKAFELYGNLLSDEARQPWEKIVQAQTTKCLWEDIYGVTHDKLLPKPGTPSWSASPPYSRCSHMTQAKHLSTTSQTCQGNPIGFQFVSFWFKSSSLIATSKLYHACTIAQVRIRPPSKYCPLTMPTS
jgi:hypothetical protein